MKTRLLDKTNALHFLGSSDRLIGRAQILLSTVCFGAVSTFAKLAYSSGTDASLLLALRFLIASAALWLYFLLFNRDALRIGRKELATCAALGIAGYAIFSSLAFKSFESLPASVAGMLFFSYPVFVMLMDWAVTRRRPRKRLMVGALMTLCGIGVGVFGSLAQGPSVGLLLAVFGAAWYAAYVITSRRLLDRVKPQTVALYVTSFAAVGFSLMGSHAASHLSDLRIEGWMAALSLGLISTVTALLAFFSGLEKLSSTEASQIATFELVVSLSLAAIVLGEPVSLALLSGAAFVVAGIVIGQTRSALQPVEDLSLHPRDRIVDAGCAPATSSRFLSAKEAPCEP